MVKVAIYLMAFYLVYLVMLSRDTSYGRNRAYILLSLAAGLILPLITFETIKPLNIQYFGKLLSEVFITADSSQTENLNSSAFGSLLQIIYSIYLIGIIISVVKLFSDLLNLLFLIVRQKSKDSHIIQFHGFKTSGFSAMGYIFINNKLLPEEADEIIRHEQNHLRHNHFVDIIFVELIKAFQWFNPVVYMFNRSLRAVHEFQADQECLNSGIPIVNYQSLLLSQVFKSKVFNLTNSFSNPSLIKRRMIMMTKERTSSLAGIKLLIVIPVTAVVFLAISAYKDIPESTDKQITSTTPEQTVSTQFSASKKVIESNPAQKSVTEIVSESKPEINPPPPPPPPKTSGSIDGATVGKEENMSEISPFTVVEEMPQYPGGDIALLKFIAENTRYPAVAKEQNVQGRVIIRFCITSEGDVSMISVIKSVSPELDAEAMRVVETLPDFKPGTQGGKAVPVWYMVPITFTLK